MPDTPQIRWQPISQLPLLASLVDEALASTQEQHRTFVEVRRKPHVLDDATVSRAMRVYRDQLEDLWLYEQQFARWQKENLTEAQRQEVDRLASQIPRIRELSESILKLLEEMKQGTIDRVMQKSDDELGREALRRSRKHH